MDVIQRVARVRPRQLNLVNNVVFFCACENVGITVSVRVSASELWFLSTSQVTGREDLPSPKSPVLCREESV